MCFRHAGKTRMHTRIPSTSWNHTLNMGCAFSDTDSTPPSKQCSQEKPTRMPRDVTTILIISRASWCALCDSSCLGWLSSSLDSASTSFLFSWLPPPAVSLAITASSSLSSITSTANTMPAAKAVSTKAMTTFWRILAGCQCVRSHHHSTVQCVAQSTHQAKHIAVALRMVFKMRRVDLSLICLLNFCMAMACTQARRTRTKPIP
mmetsp:Transcript_89037/g.238572  ORF Transcript_89037/g.238572 Transcript_89037/m.238572 type:complete len:205 (+) Transcript_89037:318-932(+)